MDLTKFLAILQRKALFFSRADRLGDPFEGTVTKSTLDHQEDSLRHLSAQFPEQSDLLEQNRERVRLWRKNMRHWCYVLCWHCNAHESAAMWKLYARTEEAVAIRTTIGALAESLEDAENLVWIGSVKYINYETDHIDWMSGFNPLLHKRLSFSHENEIRAITRDNPPADINRDLGENPAPGLYLNVRLDRLIQSVHVAPESPAWFRYLVEGVLRKYELECPVVKSSLANDPLY